MSSISENELKSCIKSKKFKNFYLLYGEENYLTEYYTNLLVDKILDGNKNDFNFKSFTKNKFNVDELERSAESVSFLSDKKCILIKDLDLSEVSSNDVKKLKDVVSNLSDSTFLIISQINVEIDKKRSHSFSTFLKFAEKTGDTLELKKLSKMALEKQLISWAKKMTKELPANCAELIIDSCQDNLLDLKNEVEKLCAYAPHEITMADVDAVVVKKLEANVFELTKLIAAKNFKGAITKLNILLKMQENPISILSILSSYFVDLYRVKVYKNAGEPVNNIKEIFPEYKNKEFKLTNAQRDCGKLELNQIKAAISALTQTDVMLKSSALDKKLVMEELFIKLQKIYCL